MRRNAPHIGWSALACLAIVAGGHYLAGAQEEEETEPAKKSPVAVIDTSRVFKEHKAFRQKLADMKVEVEAAEVELRTERDKIRELQEEFLALDAGEPLQEKLEAEIATRAAELQVKMNLQKKAFMKQEAAIYMEVYSHIETTVAAYSRERGISLVLRYNDIGPIEGVTDRDQILAAVNKAVVFEDDLDITDEILKRLERPIEKGDL